MRHQVTLNKTVNVLMVCMGNICRSPTAQAVFEKVVKEAGLSDQIQVDSAGTHAYHVGESPDSRAQATARNRGISMSHQRARKVSAVDFERFDYVIAMDNSNYEDLRRLTQNEEQLSHLHLFMSFAKNSQQSEVPDPYYGGDQGFEQVFDMVTDASQGLLESIMKQFGVT